MAEPKTGANDGDVDACIEAIEDEQKRADSRELLAIMQELSGEAPKMWGDAIIGFGRYSYRYASGRTGEWMRVGFSPRKRAISLYNMSGFGEYDQSGETNEILSRLGSYSTGKACLYIKRLADVDRDALRELISRSLSAPMGQDAD